MRTAVLNGQPLTLHLGETFIVVRMPDAEQEFCKVGLYEYSLHGTQAACLASKILTEVKTLEDLDFHLNKWVVRLRDCAKSPRLKAVYSEVARQLRQPLSSLYVS
jgi:hypothetical protein